MWTAHHWQHWLARGDFPDHPWRGHLERSALTLKGLTFAPTGALLAAATTSLPETPGGERNWDYRYSWIRDSTFALWALYTLGFDWEANDFFCFIADMAEHDDELQVMYGIGGERDLTEQVLDHLDGYLGLPPGAHRQRCVQPAPARRVGRGARLGVHSHASRAITSRSASGRSSRARSRRRSAHWRDPDRGIWEVRGEPKHFTSSKMMCWVAVDRGAKLARLRGDEALAEEWQAAADEIHADVCENGVDSRGVFTQHYDTDGLDASLLLMPLFGFLPGRRSAGRRDRARHRRRAERRWPGTAVQGRRRPTTASRARRARSRSARSGSSPRWSRSVRPQERASCARSCSRSPARWASTPRRLDPHSGRHLGNFPQAFTHLALINAVIHVIRAEREA